MAINKQEKRTTVKKKTTIGDSNRSRPLNKNDRRSKKAYVGQGK